MSNGPRPNRRDFLHGRAIFDVLVEVVTGPEPVAGDAASAAATGGDPTQRVAAGLLSSIRRRAMACEFEVQLAAKRQDGSLEYVLEALDLVEALETQLTIYRPTSEVLEINRQAAEGPVAVEPRLLAMLQLAERLHRETDGAFDITSGPLSEVWGFSRRHGRLPSDDEIAAALEHVGMQHVALDAERGTIEFRKPGVTLHLNSIGKGYALDRMAELLDSHEVGDYLLHGGRSSVLVRGDCPSDMRPGWTIGIPHPLRPDERLGEVCLMNEALGTSGSGTQFFEHEGRRYGHLLDPRTGRPVTRIYTATVIAPTAAEADALSTAFYVMDAKQVAEYCARRADVAAILISAGDRDGDMRVWQFGLDEHRWRPAVASGLVARE